jgi:acyl dehydratase
VRFAELTAGRVIHLGPASLSEREIIAFARAYDPQWFHTDPARAATSLWQGLIASGWQTCGVAMRLVCDHILAGSESFGSPGLAYLKWENPVRAGDELRLEVEVLDQRVAKSKPTLGIVRWRWRLVNQRAEPVLELEATSLFGLTPV